MSDTDSIDGNESLVDSDTESWDSYHSDDYPEDSIALNINRLRKLLSLPSDFSLGISEFVHEADTGHHSFSICQKEYLQMGVFHVEQCIPMVYADFFRKDDEYIQIVVKPGCYWDIPEEEYFIRCEIVKDWLYEAAAEHRTKKRTRLFKDELLVVAANPSKNTSEG